MEEGEGPTPQGKTVKDVPAQDFIKAYALHLKKSGRLEMPTYVDLIKTSCAKEMPPLDQDWFYVRAASLARRVYMNQGAGIGKLRKFYGGAQSRGTCPQRFRKSAGGHLRYILKQLEQLGIVEKDNKGGRKVTPNGRRDLDRIANGVEPNRSMII